MGTALDTAAAVAAVEVRLGVERVDSREGEEDVEVELLLEVDDEGVCKSVSEDDEPPLGFALGFRWKNDHIINKIQW